MNSKRIHLAFMEPEGGHFVTNPFWNAVKYETEFHQRRAEENTWEWFSSPQSTWENMNRGEHIFTLTFSTKSLFFYFQVIGFIRWNTILYSNRTHIFEVLKDFGCVQNTATLLFPRDIVKLACNIIWFHTNAWRSSKKHGTWRAIVEASCVHVRKPCWLMESSTREGNILIHILTNNISVLSFNYSKTQQTVN